jgi:acetate kinase
VTRVFVVNAGSSSVKYDVLEAESGRSLASGLVERVTDYAAALAVALDEVDAAGIDADGHRVVHGGSAYSQAVVIDDRVEAEISRLSVLAPLHNPPGLAGIRAARAALPGVPHVAVFDTAFHATLPPAAYTYAIDAAVAAEHGIRRYGFHGTSFSYVSARAAEVLGRPLGDLRMIVAHLGNGASITAIDGGRSVDTSMGMTPLEGLVMGTRSGDIDPAVLLHLQRVGAFDAAGLDDLLNRRSGILGLGGHADMRDLLAASGPEAKLAVDVYVHRLKHYIGAYAAELGGLDALVFTAGVGENSDVIRARAVEGLEFIGVSLDADANAAQADTDRLISARTSTVAVLVIPTNEELQIAREVVEVVRA